MSIYTYESPNSVQRLAHKLVVVDTSYLQHLSDPNEQNFTVILAFHQRANAINTQFLVNMVVHWCSGSNLLRPQCGLLGPYEGVVFCVT